MKQKCISLTDAIGAKTAYVSAPISLIDVAMFAVQLTYSASAGTVKLQASCDEGHLTGQTTATAADKVVNWTDVADSTVTLSGSGSSMWNMIDCGYRWVRIVQTGTATFTAAQVNVKGI